MHWSYQSFAKPSRCLLSNIFIPPTSTKLKGGYSGFTLSAWPSVDRIVSALCPQQYSSDPFHICTFYQATTEDVSCVKCVWKFKNLKFWQILKICYFDFVFLWLVIQYDSIVCVIMSGGGYPQNAGVLVVLVIIWNWIPGFNVFHCSPFLPSLMEIAAVITHVAPFTNFV